MQFPSRYLDWSVPRIMGILNVTPDSFSDGGEFDHLDAALHHTEKMLAEGADIIDIGGESTRPGAIPVSEMEELERVVPIIEAIKQRFDCLVSVDTSKARVMTEAVNAGADCINDVMALRGPGALKAASECQVPVCLMHMQGQPQTMQHEPSYQDVTQDVMAFLAERQQACTAAGISRDKILLDPGFGFGKTLAHNYQLLHQLEQLHSLGAPLLVGMSRKSMVGKLLGVSAKETLPGSLAAAVIAMTKGAQLFRVHDVAATYQALRVASAAVRPQELDV